MIFKYTGNFQHYRCIYCKSPIYREFSYNSYHSSNIILYECDCGKTNDGGMEGLVYVTSIADNQLRYARVHLHYIENSPQFVETKCTFQFKTNSMSTVAVPDSYIKNILGSIDDMCLKDLTSKLIDITVNYQTNYCNSLAFN